MKLLFCFQEKRYEGELKESKTDKDEGDVRFLKKGDIIRDLKEE